MKSGIYRYYKGKEYQFIAIALDTSTDAKTVVYRALYDCPDLEQEYEIKPYFTRSYDSFFEMVEREGKIVPRFEWVREE